MLEPSELVMWEGSVRAHDYLGKLTATATAGFGQLALTPHALTTAVAALGNAANVRAAARDHGVRIGYLDAVLGWAPTPVPAGADDNTGRRFDYTVEECLTLADTFDVRTILAAGVFDPDTVAFDDVVRSFAELCDQARDRDVHVELEFMPFGGVRDIQTAQRIIEAAGRDNSGIMVDTWHFARGVGDIDRLAGTPDGIPLSVQISDGPATPPSPDALDLMDETLHHRQPPGHGELPLDDILGAVLHHGLPRSLGPEVFSDELDQLLPGQVGELLSGTIVQVLTRATAHTNGPTSP
jgi:sugar phosphate isomerase/epimerase